YLQNIAHSPVTTRIAVTAFAAFLVLGSVSTVLSEMPQVALFGGDYRREGLIAWWIYGVFFITVLAWAQHPHRVRALLGVLLVASVVPAAYAIQQRLNLDFYPLYVRDPSRPGSTLGSPVFLGAYLALLLPIAGMRVWQSRHQRREFMLWLVVALMAAWALL